MTKTEYTESIVRNTLAPFIGFLNNEFPCKDAFQQQRFNLEVDRLYKDIYSLVKEKGEDV